jgi:hypothetical protein
VAPDRATFSERTRPRTGRQLRPRGFNRVSFVGRGDSFVLVLSEAVLVIECAWKRLKTSELTGLVRVDEKRAVAKVRLRARAPSLRD